MIPAFNFFLQLCILYSVVDPHKTYGPDGIPPFVLSASVLALCMWMVFFLFFYLPVYLHPSFFLAGDSNPLNYQTIVLISCLSNALEFTLKWKTEASLCLVFIQFMNGER